MRLWGWWRKKKDEEEAPSARGNLRGLIQSRIMRETTKYVKQGLRPWKARRKAIHAVRSEVGQYLK